MEHENDVLLTVNVSEVITYFEGDEHKVSQIPEQYWLSARKKLKGGKRQ